MTQQFLFGVLLAMLVIIMSFLLFFGVAETYWELFLVWSRMLE